MTPKVYWIPYHGDIAKGFELAVVAVGETEAQVVTGRGSMTVERVPLEQLDHRCNEACGDSVTNFVRRLRQMAEREHGAVEDWPEELREVLG